VARLAPQTLKLRDDEQSELEQLIKRHNTPQQIALRAKIVLYANLGKNNREIARILNISRNMVILWRNRWLASIGSLPRIIAAASSAWVLFIALARFFNAMPMSRRHSWAFSLGGSAASDRRSIVFSSASFTCLFQQFSF
jgi:hypothetical protein